MLPASFLKCLFFILSAAFTACTSPPKKNPDVIIVQFKWAHQPQFAGLYVAKEQGYYASENPDVRLLKGGPEIDDTNLKKIFTSPAP